MVRFVCVLVRNFADLSSKFWHWLRINAAISTGSRQAKKFGKFGENSLILFPTTTIFNQRYIHIGNETMIGEHVALSAGMIEGQVCLTDPVVKIGDRCLIGRGSGIVGPYSLEIGDDVWTGHHVYITDQSHGYEDVTRPISAQSQPERAVKIGDGSWLGHGVVVLPGAIIGKNVAVGANSVVTGELPDYCVAVGAPARVIRRYSADTGWSARNFRSKDR
ncbi:MAG: DapH/DapD/GlmU-related protein [Actinomycetota bacterium]